MNAAFMMDGEFILAITRQFPMPPLAIGRVPVVPKFDSVTFEPGGAILLDGSAKLRVGGLDVKARLTLKLLDPHLIRLRLIDFKVSGNDMLWLIKMGADEFMNGLSLPSARLVVNDKDFYADVALPVKWAPLKAILTENNQLAIVPDVPDVNAAIAGQKANAAKAAHHPDGPKFGALIVDVAPDTGKATGSTSGITPGAVSTHKPVGK